MDWFFLILSGLFEIVGVIGLKKAAEKDSWFTYLLLGAGFLVSLTLLSMALKTIPLSVAYSVWTGIGTVGATVIGILFYKEPCHWFRLVCIAGILCTIVGLKWVG